MSRAAPRITLPALVLLLAGAEATACREAVAPCATASRFAGNWRYEATQTSPSTASVSGTLVLKTAACHAVAGSLDAVARDAEGRASRVAGEVDGREVDSMSVTFDVYLVSSTRQHIAHLRGDSLVGSWLDASAGGASGAFTARR